MFFESFWLNFTIALGLIIALTFDYMTKFFSYWYVRHIPYKTSVPFYGSDYHRVIGLRSNTEEVNNLYHQHPKDDFVGSIKCRIPDLIIKNPDLIKEVLSTEFDSFKSRGLDLNQSQDICLRNNLFYAEGEKWTFLREGLELVLNDMSYLGDGLKECLSGINGNTNVQELLTKVLDVVFEKLLLESGRTSVISEMRSAFQQRTFLDKVKYYIKSIFPSVYILLGLSTVSTLPSKKELQDTPTSKKISSSFQKENNKIKLTNDDLTCGTVYSFISEGYIPCLTTLTAIFYELSKAPEIQQKARNSEEYLTAAIKECLRLHPSYSVITRKCVKTYKFQDSKVLIDRGVTVNVPVEAIHKDNGFYDEANKFKPERFLDSVSRVHSYAFLPFGAGPRKCIGEDLAVQILKTVTRNILSEFQITCSNKTPATLQVVDHNFARVIDNEVWLKFMPLS